MSVVPVLILLIDDIRRHESVISLLSLDIETNLIQYLITDFLHRMILYLLLTVDEKSICCIATDSSCPHSRTFKLKVYMRFDQSLTSAIVTFTCVRCFPFSIFMLPFVRCIRRLDILIHFDKNYH